MNPRGTGSGFLLLVACSMACKQPPSQPAGLASAAPSARVTVPSPLEGGYRIDALLALNPKGQELLGGARTSVDEMMRKSMEGGAFVYARWHLRFAAGKLTMRNDLIFKFRSGYQWTWCEAEGGGGWQGKQLALPGGLASTGRNGYVDANDSRSGTCNVALAAGTYTLEQQDGETRLRGSRDGADFAFVLVKDDTDPDIESRARALAGNPKK